MTEKTPEIDPAFVTAARRQLDRIRWRREIDRAYRGGERAEAIADRLGESVDTIISEIRKLERRPNALVRTPKEVIDEYVVGSGAETISSPHSAPGLTRTGNSESMTVSTFLPQMPGTAAPGTTSNRPARATSSTTRPSH